MTTDFVVGETLLGHFLRMTQAEHSDATGTLSAAIMEIAIGAAEVADKVRQPGNYFLGKNTDKTNIQGEIVNRLDLQNEIIFQGKFIACGAFCCLSSEELTDVVPIPRGYTVGPYTSSYDPFDGSSSRKINGPFGTIVAIHERLPDFDDCCDQQVLQAGKDIVAAAYVDYGPSTVLVFSTGQGVHQFVYNPRIGQFVLERQNVTIPEEGDFTYSINDSYSFKWIDPIPEFIDECKQDGIGARYIGAMVPDIHRTLTNGGIFMYPRYKGKENGKLRLGCECNPIAFIIEQAGGLASTGKERVLDIVPEMLHQRVPFFAGNKKLVERVEELIAAA